MLDGIMTTRAMRRFTDEPVTDEQVVTCLRAAVQAPSGGNIQPYQFVVVTDPDAKARVADVYLRAHERYEPAIQEQIPPFPDEQAERKHRRNWAMTDHLARNLADVPVLVLVLMNDIDMTISDDDGPMDVGPTHASVYPAVQNFVLAARAQGLGTVLTTVFRIYEDDMRAALDIPDRFQVVALLPLGHPEGRFGVAPRPRSAERRTSWNTYGQPERP
jgi:nitroreductase